jgi:hypothetical protein
MRLLDEQYTRTPFYGVRKMTAWLRGLGYPVNEKRIRRLLRLMGLEAIYQRPRLSNPAPGHRVYPYLLRGLAIERPNQVWSTDITYVRLLHGFVYLVAVIDPLLTLRPELGGLGDARERVSASAPWSVLWSSASRRFSTRIRARSLPRPPLLIVSFKTAFRSVWMDVAGRSTISSLSVSGVQSNMKRSIYEIMRPFPRP